MRHKLLAKGFPENIIEQVIVDLAHEGLQSDVRFAEVFSRSRAGKGYGSYRIRQELRQRGIKGEDAPDLKEMDWDGLIERVYAKKYGETVPGSLSEWAVRERFLERRGFGRDQIRRLFRRLREGGEE